MSDKTARDYLKLAQAEDNIDRAITACNEAIGLNPLYVEAYVERAWQRRFEGQFDSALADYAQAIRINPNYAEAYRERGNLRDMCLGDIDGAIADYSQAIHADPH